MIIYGHSNTCECVSSYFPPFISHMLLDPWPTVVLGLRLDVQSTSGKRRQSREICGCFNGNLNNNTGYMYEYLCTKYMMQSILWVYFSGYIYGFTMALPGVYPAIEHQDLTNPQVAPSPGDPIAGGFMENPGDQWMRTGGIPISGTP